MSQFGDDLRQRTVRYDHLLLNLLDPFLYTARKQMSVIALQCPNV